MRWLLLLDIVKRPPSSTRESTAWLYATIGYQTRNTRDPEENVSLRYVIYRRWQGVCLGFGSKTWDLSCLCSFLSYSYSRSLFRFPGLVASHTPRRFVECLRPCYYCSCNALLVLGHEWNPDTRTQVGWDGNLILCYNGRIRATKCVVCRTVPPG